MTRFPVLICVLVLGTASCAEIPTAELTAYKQAFGSARQSAETVIADYRNALQEASAIAPRSAASPFPEVFEPESFLSGDARDANVASRLRALEVLGQYNNVLVALAEGKSEEEVRGAVGAFSSSLSTLVATFGSSVPALSAITRIAQTIAGLVENARRREEFRRIVDEGAPVVRQIIDEVFIPDTRDFYEVRAALADQRTRLLGRLTGEAAKTASLIGGQHADPPANSGLASSRASAQGRLRDVVGRVGLSEATFDMAGSKRSLFDLSASGSNGKAYTELVQVRIDQLVASAEERSAKYQKVVEDTVRFHALLGAYVQMLNQTKISLELVRHRLNDPPQIEALAGVLATTAVSLKADYDRFLASRSQ